MSVNYYLLPVSDDELAAVLQYPEQLRAIVERRSIEVQDLREDGVAIATLTAESNEDPLAFLLSGGAPNGLSGWVGKYIEEDGRVVVCELDMGYGPASYYKNGFLREVASKLEPITADVFAASFDPNWMDAHHIYPHGWLDPWRKEMLVESFNRYRACVLATAKLGQHLVVWCG